MQLNKSIVLNSHPKKGESKAIFLDEAILSILFMLVCLFLYLSLFADRGSQCAAAVSLRHCGASRPCKLPFWKILIQLVDPSSNALLSCCFPFYSHVQTQQCLTSSTTFAEAKIQFKAYSSQNVVGLVRYQLAGGQSGVPNFSGLSFLLSSRHRRWSAAAAA